MAEPYKARSKSGLRSPWLWAIFALFAVMFTVNFLFFTVGKNTAPGLVNEEYYKYGLQQNKIDKQYRKQAARGWRVDLSTPQPWRIHEPKDILLTVTDKTGKPLSGGLAEVTAYRPSNAKYDIIQQLKETEQPGVYKTSLKLPLQGIWDINILFTLGEDKHMLNKRIHIIGDGEAEPSLLENIVRFITK